MPPNLSVAVITLEMLIFLVKSSDAPMFLCRVKLLFVLIPSKYVLSKIACVAACWAIKSGLCLSSTPLMFPTVWLNPTLQ